ncbi:MAG TPA: GNAT family N-acetyltransferase [Anaerolineaceae bacterium]|nr:GNAT family N-acetyltransferase [Anaerolineaceae bacterium]HPN50711.1 GNAT family N-acetyltransferase [Anaerolineaceae bacterium]
MRVREGTFEDIPAAATVRVKTWQAAYRGIVPDEFLDNLSIERNIARWQANFSVKDHFSLFYVGENDAGEVVGFALGGAERDGDPEYHGEIGALYIFPEYQGKGLGRMLVQAFAAALVDEGFTDMLIWVLTDNHPSRRFYEAMGGQAVRQKEQEIGGKPLQETGYGWKDILPLAEAGRKQV